MERRFAVPARNAYGIDTFGEAIEKARVNSKIAGMQTNYINRDYFDFVHDYKFDEIVTDLPAGKLSKPELDDLYRRFFEKSVPSGSGILYSGEKWKLSVYCRKASVRNVRGDFFPHL